MADELNVKRIVFAETTKELGRWHAKPDFRALGPVLGPRVKLLAAALEADDGSLAAALARGDDVTVSLADGDVTLTPDTVDLTQDVREGWGVASDGGVTVALDLALTDELRTEGTARGLIRAVQDARKAAGLDVADRIQLGIQAGPVTSAAIDAHRDVIVAETLAVDLILGEVDGPRQEMSVDDEPVVITVARAAWANPATA